VAPAAPVVVQVNVWKPEPLHAVGAPPLQLNVGVVETIRMSPLPEPLVSTQALMVVAVMAEAPPATTSATTRAARLVRKTADL
jgi:hypothetical protein